MPGVISGHAYSVLGTEERDGKRCVVLRNPWGKTEAGNDGKDDDIFALPVESFVRAYRMVEYVQP